MPTRKNKSFKDSCAPKSRKQTLQYSCYTRESLLKLRKMWNARHKDVRIRSKNPRHIWTKLKIYLKSICNKESCWLRQNFAKYQLDKTILEYTFAPKAPKEWEKKPLMWLNSLDILKVMKQYERAYEPFVFIGPTPIDFDKEVYKGECVWNELCKFNLGEYIKAGKKKIGIIFNLDPHDKEGSHWICSFIDIKKKEIYYFDSYGEDTPKQIFTFSKSSIKFSFLLCIKHVP